MTSSLPGSVKAPLHPRRSKTPDTHAHLFLFSPPGSPTFWPTAELLSCLSGVFASDGAGVCSEHSVCERACVRSCVPHTFLCQHNAASCNVYFMLCWPSPRVELQQPSNIHTAEAHLHIKGPRAAKSTWSEYLSLAVPLSLSPYVSCLSLPFQLSALPPPPPNTPTFLF